MIQFYQCNLRVLLVAVDFEGPIDTAQDVVNRGQTVYMFSVLHAYYKNGA